MPTARPTHCPCGRALPNNGGRPRRYCSAECKTAADTAARTARAERRRQQERTERERERAAALVRVLPDYRGIADALSESSDPDTREVARAAAAMLSWLERHADDEDADTVGTRVIVDGVAVRLKHVERRHDPASWTMPAGASAELDEGLIPDRSDQRRPDHWSR